MPLATDSILLKIAIGELGNLRDNVVPGMPPATPDAVACISATPLIASLVFLPNEETVDLRSLPNSLK